MPKKPELAVCEPPKLEAAVSTELVRLDLACGDVPKEGFVGVDLHAEKAQKVDLLKFPWPWKDNSVDELHCSHFIEHIPATFVTEGKAYVGSDYLCAFMDEAWRILKNKGPFTIVVPNARCNRAFQDPTHRRFFVAESFLYFNKRWREDNKLGHYLGRCNFDMNVDPIIPTHLAALHPEAQARRFSENWNTILDWQARLVAVKDQ